MDPALLRERELFKKKALSTPIVEKKKKEETPKEDVKKKPKPIETTSVAYKAVSGSSEYKFGVLANIVKYMRTRHQEGEDHALSLEEILDETNQLFVSTKVKQWLETEALQNNPKIDVTPDNKFLFKPPFKIKDKKGLLRLIKQQDLKSSGGIYLEDVRESLPHCEKALKHLQNELVIVTRPLDKKKVLFYNDRTPVLMIDEEFPKLWRSVAIESMDDDKIQDYLEKQGIKSMQDFGIKKVALPMKRKNAGKRRKLLKKPRDNEHIADVLETYDNL